MTARGRRRLALEHGALHSRTRKPGLVGVDFEGTVSSDGLEISTYVVGPDDAEATVVFIHGFTLAAEVFYMQVDYLRTNFPGVRSLLIDARGHGQTGPVAPALCTVEGTAHDVLAAIREHAPTGPLILVGHSLGGLTALNLIKNADHELASRISGLVLVATSIESLSAQGLPQVLASPIADRVRGTAEASPGDAAKFREYASQFLAPTLATAVFHRPTNWKVIEFHAAMIHETPLETFVGFFDDLQEHDELDAAAALEDVDGFVIAGEKDNVTPLGQAERICELWPKAHLQIAADAGHMIPLEAPMILNNAIAALLRGISRRRSAPRNRQARRGSW
ncbi:alpha/beta fold hydrolase [Corynebacterium pacaense]|uniref:alpha/beta fold hydrolase n=1 Tax=Corynebacterium pacaense TaxID=1816684 RepID=UPI0009B94BBA|nr:alpha/beta hydrolase [Corynebacterium pacaense]